MSQFVRLEGKRTAQIAHCALNCRQGAFSNDRRREDVTFPSEGKKALESVYT